ncbi:hypothetical protein LPJ54_005968, partial [Coemansia sp. RSA 1824]
MALTSYRRLVWRHLPIMIVGILAGYIVGCNKPAVHQTLSFKHIFSRTPQQTVIDADINNYEPNGVKPVKAALVALVRNSDLFGLRSTIRQIEDRFNARHNYPYIFVNDVEFTEEFKRGVRDLTQAHVHFGILDEESWKVPEWINREQYEHVKSTA